MRRLVFFLVVLAILAGGAVLGLPLVAGPFLRDKILSTLNESGTGQYMLATARIQSLFPITIELNDFGAQLTEPSAQIQAGRIAAKFVLQKWSFNRIEAAKVELEILEPSVALKIAEKKTATQVPIKEEVSSPGLPNAVTKMALAVNLRIQKGELHVEAAQNKILAKDLNLQITTSNLFESESPISVELTSKIQLPAWLKDELAVQVEAKKLFVSPDALRGEAINVVAAGLQLTANGETQFKQSVHHWNFDIYMPALEKLSVPPQFLPPGKWQGGVIGKVAVKMAGNTPPAIVGQLRTQNLRGDIELQTAPAYVKGVVAPEIDLDFSYERVPVIKKLDLKVDLTALTIQYGELFSKPTGVPMSVNAQVHGTNEQMTVDSLSLVLGQIKAALSGTIGLSTKSSSNLRVVVHPTSLNGLERLVRPLQASPLTGQISANANITGDIFNPEKMAVQVDDLKLVDVRGGFVFSSADKTLNINGPFAVNVAGSATVKNFLPLKASMKGLVDLSEMEISKKDVYEKAKNSPMILNFDFLQTGKIVLIRQFGLDSAILSVSGKGKIENPEKPRITSALSIQKIQLKDLADLIPELKPYRLMGKANGQVTLSGTVNPKTAFQQWPLAAVGTLNVDIPQIILPKPQEPPPQAKSETSGEAVTLLEVQDKLPDPQPLLPEWPIIRNSTFGLSAKIGEIKYGDLNLKNISFTAIYGAGEAVGSLSIEKVLDGSLRSPKLSARQLFSRPQFSAQINANTLSLPKILSTFVPEYKQYVEGGKADGIFSVQTPTPQTKHWLRKVVSSGEIKIRQLRTKDNVIEKVIGEKLSQFAKDKKALSGHPKPLIADVKANFSLANAVANVKNFSLVATDGNEFQGSGKIGLDLLADLNGTLHLSKVDIGGDVRAANSDEKGRFVVPVHFKGPLANPSFDVAAAALEQIAKKTLKYSTKKATSGLKEKLKGKAKDEMKKHLKDLFK